MSTSRRSRCAGFTLVELLVSIAIAAILMAIGVPALHNLFARRTLEGYARSVAMLTQRGRYEALNRGVPVVVYVSGGSVVAFADVHGAAATDPPDGVYNPLATPPSATGTDYEVGRQPMPDKLELAAPGGGSGIVGFTSVGGDQRAIFQPDGSVSDTGGFIFGDPRSNFLEVKVSPQATGRVEILKWDGSAWRANGEGGHAWEWN